MRASFSLVFLFRRRSHAKVSGRETNVTALPVRISRVEVLDAATRQTLLSLAGTALHGEFTPIGAPSGDEGTDDPGNSLATTTPSSATWVVWLDVSLPARSAVPRHLEHRVAGAIIVPGGATPVSAADRPDRGQPRHRPDRPRPVRAVRPPRPRLGQGPHRPAGARRPVARADRHQQPPRSASKPVVSFVVTT